MAGHKIHNKQGCVDVTHTADHYVFKCSYKWERMDGVMCMCGQVVYCKQDQRGLTILLRLFRHDCTAWLEKLNV
jgi:hypothetical protein